MSVLETTLSKLARYDEGSLFSSILSLTVSSIFCMLAISFPQLSYFTGVIIMNMLSLEVFSALVDGCVINGAVIMLLLQKPTDELGRSYVGFMRAGSEQIHQNIVDELYILGIFEVSTEFPGPSEEPLAPSFALCFLSSELVFGSDQGHL